MPTQESPIVRSPTKRTPRKAAARGKWSEEQLLTSDKSVLIDADLVKLLASSKAWNCLDEDEKRQILDFLPADTHPNPDPPADDPHAKIPPLPDSFVRYSNNWRDGIRQFQLDLQHGRYDPEWLRQAEEARQERENGEFESFKEREYEEFWGQKQKLDKRLAAGESGKVKLGTLVEEGAIQIGDVWRFNYVYGKGAERIVIDKETRVHEINGSKLTFVMPAGQRVFLKSVITEAPTTALSGQEDGAQEMQRVELDTIMTEEPETKEVPESKEVPEVPLMDPNSQKKDEVQMVNESEEDIIPDARIVQGEFKIDSKERAIQQWDDVCRDREERINLLVSSPLSTPPPSLEPTSSQTEPQSTPQEAQSKVQVVIMSPMKAPCENLKRSISQPAEESPVKRKRGRPPKPKTFGPQPKSEPKSESVSALKEDPVTESIHQTLHRPNVQVLVESPNLEPKPEPKPDMHNIDNIVHSTMTPSTDDLKVESISPPDDVSQNPENTTKDLTPTTHTSASTQSNSISASQPKLQAAIHTTAPLTQPLTQDSSEVVSTNKAEEVFVRDVTSPRALVQEILATDGRAVGKRTANAWKEFRCYRNNQDMGSPWDIRQTWYYKKNPTSS
ncbi:hypothetical protein N7520_003501 [Penicillium odoratum]|uniref:uncharacterized protein n=1 Tax=Penicillium odoratum TaxID=1167516 RepID=UPI002546E455|nr:uncharacterized protein N7520_003501 [Penicillium odoratum]KAJ5768942.1 hypothetical protein N7520_003501 [Penicillium odoratum]